jgi:hypothetical protein
MKSFLFALGALFVALLAGSAQAALLGVTQTFPDINTTSTYLIYDHDGVNSTTGLLRVVAATSVLNEGAATGGSTQSQAYLSAGDTTPDVVLSIQVRNGTGGFSAGTLVGGSVSVGFGNAIASPRFSWTGNITALGSTGGPGTIFDALWTVGTGASGDHYQNMPASMGQFVDGFLAGGSGGIKLTSSAAFGGSANFGNDWIYGTSPQNSTLAPYRVGMVANPVLTVSTITADVFAEPPAAIVPLPPALWLLGSGLLVLAPIARRKRDRAAA